MFQRSSRVRFSLTPWSKGAPTTTSKRKVIAWKSLENHPRNEGLWENMGEDLQKCQKKIEKGTSKYRSIVYDRGTYMAGTQNKEAWTSRILFLTDTWVDGIELLQAWNRATIDLGEDFNWRRIWSGCPYCNYFVYFSTGYGTVGIPASEKPAMISLGCEFTDEHLNSKCERLLVKRSPLSH